MCAKCGQKIASLLSGRMVIRSEGAASVSHCNLPPWRLPGLQKQ